MLEDTEMDSVSAQGQVPRQGKKDTQQVVVDPELSDAELEKLVGSGQTLFSPLDQPFRSLSPLPLQDYFNANETQNNPTLRTPRTLNLQGRP